MHCPPALQPALQLTIALPPSPFPLRSITGSNAMSEIAHQIGSPFNKQWYLVLVLGAMEVALSQIPNLEVRAGHLCCCAAATDHRWLNQPLAAATNANRTHLVSHWLRHRHPPLLVRRSAGGCLPSAPLAAWPTASSH